MGWNNGYATVFRFWPGYSPVAGMAFEKDSDGVAQRRLAVATNTDVYLYDVSRDIGARSLLTVHLPQTGVAPRVRRRLLLLRHRLYVPHNHLVALYNTVSQRGVRNYYDPPHAGKRVNCLYADPSRVDVLVAGYAEPGGVSVFDVSTGQVLRSEETNSRVYATSVSFCLVVVAFVVLLMSELSVSLCVRACVRLR